MTVELIISRKSTEAVACTRGQANEYVTAGRLSCSDEETGQSAIDLGPQLAVVTPKPVHICEIFTPRLCVCTNADSLSRYPPGSP